MNVSFVLLRDLNECQFCSVKGFKCSPDLLY